MNEQNKYEVIKKLVDENGNKDRAAEGVLPEHIYIFLMVSGMEV